MKNIFILTEKKDPHADRVISLISPTHKVMRANTDTYGDEWEVEMMGNQLIFIDHKSGNEYKNFHAAWLRRKINKPNFNKVTKYDELTNDFLTSQNYVIADAAIKALKSPQMMNSYYSTEFANSKFNHLKMFSKVGINTPKSLITASDKKLKQYVKQLKSDIAVKQVYSDILIYEEGQKMLRQLTKKFNLSDIDKLIPIGPTPMYFQEYIEKKYEYRVTAVGDKVFSCLIDSKKSFNETKHDWRHYDFENTPHYAKDLPQETTEKVVQLLKEYKLNYCAIDLIEDPNGIFYGVDINPMGQYLWIEDFTDMPISQAIAKWLSND